MNKYDKAKKILIEEGYVSAYYKILDVTNGNKNSTNFAHENRTRSWGWKVLDQRLEF